VDSLREKGIERIVLDLRDNGGGDLLSVIACASYFLEPHDVIIISESKNGTRDEAIVASIRPFFTKFGSALCVLLTSVSYLLLGVTDYTNEISAFEQAANMGKITEAEKLASIDSVIASVTSLQSHGLLLVMCLVPLVMMIVAYLLYKKHYILDEDEYDRIVAELATRNK
jgi:melibiose permease/lactose/raffinose/galactose permease